MVTRGIHLIKSAITPAFLAALLIALLPTLAHAAATLNCTGGGGGSGGLFDTTSDAMCQNQGNFIEHLFSNIVCTYVEIIDAILSALYCGIQFAVKDVLEIALVLYIAIFGVQILTGQTQLAGGEIVMRSVKLAFVWLFATESSYGIGIAFNFFLGVISDGSGWVVSAIVPGAAGHDAFFFLDELIYGAIVGPFTEANSKVVGFFLVMSVAFFPIFIMGVAFMWETAMLMVSCVLALLLSISAIAFLISLSPIFLCFMLFQSTFYLFENWLRYMMSYSLQIVVVFGIVTMWVQVIIIFIGFFNDLSDMIFPYKEALKHGPVLQPTDNWGVCPPSYGMNAFGPTVSCDGGFDPDNPVSAPTLIPPSRIMEIKGFLYYVIFHMTTLILIAYAFRILLKNASQIARDLVGPAYVPMLGKGFGMEALGNPTGYPRRMHMRSMGGSDRRAPKPK